MATIVNNPGASTDNNGMAMMLGAVALIVVLLLVLFYATPMFRGGSSTPNAEPGTSDTIINQQESAPPAESGSSDTMNINVPEVDVPENIDVDINQGE